MSKLPGLSVVLTDHINAVWYTVFYELRDFYSCLKSYVLNKQIYKNF